MRNRIYSKLTQANLRKILLPPPKPKNISDSIRWMLDGTELASLLLRLTANLDLGGNRMNVLAKLSYLFRKSVKAKRGMNPIADRANGNERKLIEICAMPSERGT